MARLGTLQTAPKNDFMTNRKIMTIVVMDGWSPNRAPHYLRKVLKFCRQLSAGAVIRFDDGSVKQLISFSLSLNVEATRRAAASWNQDGLAPCDLLSTRTMVGNRPNPARLAADYQPLSRYLSYQLVSATAHCPVRSYRWLCDCTRCHVLILLQTSY